LKLFPKKLTYAYRSKIPINVFLGDFFRRFFCCFCCISSTTIITLALCRFKFCLFFLKLLLHLFILIYISFFKILSKLTIPLFNYQCPLIWLLTVRCYTASALLALYDFLHFLQSPKLHIVRKFKTANLTYKLNFVSIIFRHMAWSFETVYKVYFVYIVCISVCRLFHYTRCIPCYTCTYYV
jgi:hypothetical protein